MQSIINDQARIMRVANRKSPLEAVEFKHLPRNQQKYPS